MGGLLGNSSWVAPACVSFDNYKYTSGVLVGHRKSPNVSRLQLFLRGCGGWIRKVSERDTQLIINYDYIVQVLFCRPRSSFYLPSAMM